MSSRPSRVPETINLDAMPGYNIRRLQQIAVGIFLEEAQDCGITPVQYAALQAVANAPDIDQRTLARTIGFDTSTIGGVVDRLEARNWIVRNADANDRRVRRLTITTDGKKLLLTAVPAMLRAQRRIMAPLGAREQATFLALLQKLVAGNNQMSRAPSEPPA